MKMILALLLLSFLSVAFQQAEPWKEGQLLEPSELARVLSDTSAPQPYVYNIGPQALIKNSIDIGPGQEKGNLQQLKAQVSKLPKDADIVLYCGCCPFAKCPNIRPAFALLNEMGFTAHKLLNIRQNIKADWLDKNYPTSF
jgi:thiosulfate/3-mercaptopyruvate sulfurtransferase